MPKKKIIFVIFFILTSIWPFYISFGQEAVNIDARTLMPKTAVFPLPIAGTFIENSVFEVPIIIDTRGNSINTVELHVKFDPNKLTIIKPSGDKSIIAVWLEPPTYSNTNGSAKLTGIIPNGIKTSSGLIATMTFKAIATGNTTVSISQATRVLLNDGAGTETQVDYGRADYTILPLPPGGVKVFSETHPFSDKWYNNNNPILAWEKDLGVSGFSYLLDNMPFTVPDNISEGEDTIKFYEGLPDGLSYFHVKALKRGIWGTSTHFLIRIDATPPAEFTPRVEYFTAAIISRASVSFFTTDNLSGINHYEVGIIQKSEDPTQSPVFIQSESPYQLPLNIANEMLVVVRAFDNAGNARDESIGVKPTFGFINYIIKNLNLILISLIGLMVLAYILHYIFGHHLINILVRALKLAKKEKKKEELTRLTEERLPSPSSPPPQSPPLPQTKPSSPTEPPNMVP